MRVLVFISLCFLSSTAFAKRNYFRETCTFSTPKGIVAFHKDPYFDGYHMSVSSNVPGIEYNLEVYLPGGEAAPGDKASGNEAIIFKDTVDANLRMEKYDDGCWQGAYYYFNRTSTIEKIQPAMASILNLKSEDKVSMECHYEELMIRGDSCHEE
jgi:hypothetical protein